MPKVEVVSEEEGAGGWSFQLRIGAEGSDPAGAHTLYLSWADYNFWCADGADPPHAVAEAVARFVLSRMAATDLPDRIDASSARRRFPDADQEIPKLIRR